MKRRKGTNLGRMVLQSRSDGQETTWTLERDQAGNLRWTCDGLTLDPWCSTVDGAVTLALLKFHPTHTVHLDLF